jgi:hypothetical protein
MADLITLARMKQSPGLDSTWTDAQLSTYISISSDLIALYCNKYLPTLNLTTPSSVTQEACALETQFLLTQASRNFVVQSETVKGYSYTNADGAMYTSIPQNVIQLLQMGVMGKAVEEVKDAAPVLDLWYNPNGGLNPYNPYNESPR